MATLAVDLSVLCVDFLEFIINLVVGYLILFVNHARSLRQALFLFVFLVFILFS